MRELKSCWVSEGMYRVREGPVHRCDDIKFKSLPLDLSTHTSTQIFTCIFYISLETERMNMAHISLSASERQEYPNVICLRD